MNIYCGNNFLDSDLINGNSILGTLYGCFRKGIGKGLHLPYDEKYALDYDPIDTRKIYCGNNGILPEGYDRFGNLPQCLQKGVAVGKRQKALEHIEEDGGENIIENKKEYKIILYIIISIILFILLYKIKPKIILKKNKKIIDWKKFIIFYTIMIFIMILIFHNF